MTGSEKIIILRRDPDVRRCKKISDAIHARDKRKISRTLYTVHTDGVAAILQKLHFSSIQICAGLLHDTVEEHPSLTFDGLLEMLLHHRIDEVRALRIISIVRAVSIDEAWPENEAYERYCDAIEAEPEAIPVAMADRLDNLRDIKLHLGLNVPVFDRQFLNCDPQKEMVNWLAVIAACCHRAFPKDLDRITLLADEAARLTMEIRHLLARRKPPRK